MRENLLGGTTLTRLAALGTLSRTAGEGGPSAERLVGEGRVSNMLPEFSWEDGSHLVEAVVTVTRRRKWCGPGGRRKGRLPSPCAAITRITPADCRSTRPPASSRAP